jgi:oligopeptide transport system substrate-binding protein
MGKRKEICFVFIVGVVLVAALALVSTAGSWIAGKLGAGGGSVAERAAREGVLLVNNVSEPESLDPHTASSPAALRVAGALFEGLLAPDPQTLEPRPALAESWTVSADGRVWSFQLRKDLRWSDGTPLTAGDFIYSWERVRKPALAAPYAALLAGVKFRATGAGSLQIELPAPCPYFGSLLCQPVWAPVPRHVIEKCGAGDAPDSPWTRPANIVSCGAFVLKTWRVGDRIELVRNPRYWNAGAVRLNAVRFFAIGDLLAEERAFRGGLLHLTSSVPPMKVERYQESKNPALRLDPFFSTTFVRVNTRDPALRDSRVRRALSLAIDRDAIARHVMRAGEVPAFSLTPPGVAGYTCASPLRENAGEARRLLTEAGFAGGQNFPPLRYLYNTHETSHLIAQALQARWREVLGIHVELQSQEWKVYKHALATGAYQLARSAWSGDFPDPAAFLELFTSNSEQNQTGWKSEQFDAAFAGAANARTAGERLAAYQRAEALLLTEAPVIPLVHNRNKFLIAPEVHGWFANALDVHPLGAVWLEPAVTRER